MCWIVEPEWYLRVSQVLRCIGQVFDRNMSLWKQRTLQRRLGTEFYCGASLDTTMRCYGYAVAGPGEVSTRFLPNPCSARDRDSNAAGIKLLSGVEVFSTAW